MWCGQFYHGRDVVWTVLPWPWCWQFWPHFVPVVWCGQFYHGRGVVWTVLLSFRAVRQRLKQWLSIFHDKMPAAIAGVIFVSMQLQQKLTLSNYKSKLLIRSRSIWKMYLTWLMMPEIIMLPASVCPVNGRAECLILMHCTLSILHQRRNVHHIFINLRRERPESMSLTQPPWQHPL